MAKRELAPIIEAAEAYGEWSDMTTMPPAQVAAAASLKGLQQLYRIIDQPLDYQDMKQMRLVGDMALGVNRLFMKAAKEEREGDVLTTLLDIIKAEKAKKPE